jgi:hypothetical protein
MTGKQSLARLGCTLIAVGLMATAIAAGQTATAPASQPATAPEQGPPLDPAVERILDRLEKKVVRDIQADLVYTKLDPILEDKQVYKGTIRYRHEEPNPRFFIRFDEVIHDGQRVKDPKEWHVFDGRFYIEAREKTRTAIYREILRPGEKEDLFKVGQGPFPMPFGQKKQDILRNFTVRLVPSSPGDPKNTEHLECTPLPDTEMARRYGAVHFFIDRKQDIPVKVMTVEKEQGNEISATFANIRLNQGVDPDALKLPDLGYTEQREMLPPEEPPPAVPDQSASPAPRSN